MIAQDAVAPLGDATLRTRAARASAVRRYFYDDSRSGAPARRALNRAANRTPARDYREPQRTQSGEE